MTPALLFSTSRFSVPLSASLRLYLASLILHRHSLAFGYRLVGDPHQDIWSPRVCTGLFSQALPYDPDASASSHSDPYFLHSQNCCALLTLQPMPWLGKCPQGKSWLTVGLPLARFPSLRDCNLALSVGNHLPHIFGAVLYTPLYTEGGLVQYQLPTIPGTRSLSLWVEDTLQPTLPYAQTHIFVTRSTNNKY